jgi:N-acetylmuramoyl-L-alanine amidase
VEELARSIYNGFLNYRKNLTHDGGTDLPRPEPANEQTNEPATQEETQTAEEQKESAQNNEPSDKNDVAPEKTEKAPAKTDHATQGMPVFKIQICSSGHKLREDASQFKKLTPVDYYQENNLYKYTYGTTPSYKEIVALKKSIQDKFPDCFIVAFKGTQKISVQEALKQTNKK